jgi:biopolymer transport protein ExbD
MKKRRTTQETDNSTFKPQLTSLVDIMAIILVFLIKTFSTEASIVTPAADLELPLSTSLKPPAPQWSIEIGKGTIMSDGAVIASTASYAKKKDSLLIPELYQWLSQKRKIRADTSIQVQLQCDKEVPYAIVKKVMYTCSKAAFTDFSVLVLREE